MIILFTILGLILYTVLGTVIIGFINRLDIIIYSARYNPIIDNIAVLVSHIIFWPFIIVWLIIVFIINLYRLLFNFVSGIKK